MELREARRSQNDDVSELLNENGWQQKYENPQDHIGSLFNDYTLYDVIFLCRDREIPAVDLPVVAVDDTTAGLGRLAAEHRAHFDGPVVGITGSNGKTTAKEMCAAILETGARTLRSLSQAHKRARSFGSLVL